MTRADHAQQNDRCNVTKEDVFQSWLQERKIEDVEAFVPDMAGSARGKVVPADKFGASEMKMPEAIFSQTISGDYIADPENVEDRDMWLIPDSTTLRPVPWAADPAASVFLDCYHRDKSIVSKSPRAVLRSVLAKFEARGWVAVVAPEGEFYLLSPHSDPNAEAEPPEEILCLFHSLISSSEVLTNRDNSVDSGVPIPSVDCVLIFSLSCTGFIVFPSFYIYHFIV